MRIIKNTKCKSKSKGNNPYAICHTTVDSKENPKKYKKCVNDIKKKND